MVRTISVALCCAAAGVAMGCASKRPVLYPNEVVRDVGWAAAQRDVNECLKAAESYGAGSDPAVRTAGSTARGSAAGAAVGGAAGAVRGRGGVGAATGAAAGAAGGLVRGVFRWRDPDPIERRFVDVCLGRQGYQVIGWK